MRPKRATSNALFAVCADRYPEPVARVASTALFWSQFAQGNLRGREGIYKTDADLAAELRKHPKTVGRLLRKVCAPEGQETPDTLFVAAYGPKRGAFSGRVRWLFTTVLADEIIAQAIALAEARLGRKAQRQNAASSRRRALRSAPTKSCDRSPQTTPTLNNLDSSNEREDDLSLAQEEKQTTHPSRQEGLQEQVIRLERLWKAACIECKKPEQAWTQGEIRRYSSELVEFIEDTGLASMSDEDLLAKLCFLAKDLHWLGDRVSSRFMTYNQQGLLMRSFTMYGPVLWRAVEKRFAEEHGREKRKPKSVASFFALKSKEDGSGPTSQ